MTATYHIPALLQQSINGMNLNPNSICVDVTFGGGGHSREILKQLAGKGHLYSFDQDIDALKNVPDSGNFTFIHGNFRFLKNFMKYNNVEAVDAILADLGVSFHHFDSAQRGFSFRYEEEDLDMRMNQNARKTAADILNSYKEDDLANVFYLYGELRQSRKIASEIINRRKENPFKKIKDFLQVITPFVGREKEKKILAQAFQALRIETNQEMDVLKEMLQQSLEILKSGGRISIITYHSLEDRLVKNFLKTGNFEGNVKKDFFGNIEAPFRIKNNKVIVPSEEEQQNNPRSRSAKLRIAEKI